MSWVPFYALYAGGAMVTVLLLALLRPAVWSWGRAVIVGMTIAPVLTFMITPLILHLSSLWSMAWIALVSGAILGFLYGTIFWYYWGRRGLSL
jgi:hypothetical protein